MNWQTKLKNWVIDRSKSKYADWWLGAFSFGDSAFFPIPPDPILIGITICKPDDWRRLVILTIVTSILGAILGYVIGYWFFESIMQPLIEVYGYQEMVTQIGIDFADNAVLALMLAAFTPIPFKVFTIAAGFFKINFILFIITCIIGRALRFSLVGYLSAKFGRSAVTLFSKHLKLGTIIFLILLGLYIYFH